VPYLFPFIPRLQREGGFLLTALVSKPRRRWIPIFSFIIVLSSCKGFFVDPTLKSITVTPVTPSIEEGGTEQMTATGTYDDGNSKNITGSVSWSSGNAAVFTVSDRGLITANHAGSASIKATSATISGSTTVCVTVGNLSSITITPTDATITSSETQQYTATGTLDNGSQVDITDSVTWSSSNKNVATISSSGLATAQGTGTTYIVAISGSITSNTATLNVD
jgi:trimeric autotransporter adhesin